MRGVFSYGKNTPAYCLLALLLAAPPAATAAVTIDWVMVGQPNNLADTPSTSCFAANCRRRATTHGSGDTMTIRNTITETGFGTVLGALTFRGEPGAKSGALSWRRQGDGHLGLNSRILGEAMARIGTAALAFAIGAAFVFAAGAVLMPRP